MDYKEACPIEGTGRLGSSFRYVTSGTHDLEELIGDCGSLRNPLLNINSRVIIPPGLTD